MNIEKLHPELRKAYKRIPSVPFHNRLFLSFIKLISRIPRKSPVQPGVIITEQKLQQAAVRIYQPERNLSGAGILWIHGGGYFMGDAAINDRECAMYARELNITVISVEYRLAPEQPSPLD